MDGHPGSFYIDRLAQPSVSVPIPTVPTVGGPALRRANIARVKVRPDDACSWRVTLAPLTFLEPTPGDIIDFTLGLPNKPRAIVTWGHDSVSQTAQIDWPCNGGSFNVWGDDVTVDIQIPATWLTGIGPSFVQAGGFILPGTVAGGMRPTFSQYGGRTQGAGTFSAAVEIPRYARSVRWHQGIWLGAPPVLPVPIRWYGALDAGTAATTFTSNMGVFNSSEGSWPGPDGLTWPADTRFLVWQNDTPLLADDLTLNLEFVLDLG